MLTFDANVLVYAVDPDANEKQEIAQQLLLDASLSDAVIAEQCLFEFLHVATGKKRHSLGVARNAIAKWTAVFPVIRPGNEVLTETLLLLDRHRLSTWDARLIATCAANGCEILLSEDMQDGGVYDGVRVINPFAGKNAILLREILAQ